MGCVTLTGVWPKNPSSPPRKHENNVNCIFKVRQKCFNTSCSPLNPHLPLLADASDDVIQGIYLSPFLKKKQKCCFCSHVFVCFEHTSPRLAISFSSFSLVNKAKQINSSKNRALDQTDSKAAHTSIIACTETWHSTWDTTPQTANLHTVQVNKHARHSFFLEIIVLSDCLMPDETF